MATEDFKAGDEVQHKSGGPKMIFERLDNLDEEQAVCSYWDGKKHVRNTFPLVVLKKWQPPPGPQFHALG